MKKELLVICLLAIVVLASGCVGKDETKETEPVTKPASLSIKPYYGIGFEEIRYFDDIPTNKFGFPIAVEIKNEGEETAYDVKVQYLCEHRGFPGHLYVEDGNNHFGWYSYDIDDKNIPYLKGGMTNIVRPVGFTSKAGYDFVKKVRALDWNWDGIQLPLSLDCIVTAWIPESTVETNVRITIM